MTKYFVAFAFAATLAPPVLAADAPRTYAFQADGRSFDVVRSDTASGTILSGVDSDGKRFRLRVSGTRVTGEYAGSPIRFAIPAPIAESQIAALD